MLQDFIVVGKAYEEELICPNRRGKRAGVDTWYFYELNDKLCTLEYNGTCPEWDEIQKEWLEEKV